MLTALTEGPLLWFLNRGSGTVLLVVLTLSTSLGILGAGRSAGGRLPAFVPQALHRNLSVLGLALTLVHVLTAVLDGFVDIRWWQALLPFGAEYEPVWLGLGTLASDVMIVVALSTLARHRLGHRAWRRVHLAGYAAWPLAFAHGAGIGTDAGATWARWLALGCAALVLVSVVVRLTRRRPTPVSAEPAPGTRHDGSILLGGRR